MKARSIPSPRQGWDADDRFRGRWWIYLLLVLLSVASHLEAQAELAALDGDPLRESALTDGATIVVVWASWSPRCRKIAEQVNELEARWGSKARVITVNFQESPEVARGFLAGKRMSAPVFLDQDGAFSKKHAVTWLPGLLVFKEGEIPYKGRFAADVDSTLARFF